MNVRKSDAFMMMLNRRRHEYTEFQNLVKEAESSLCDEPLYRFEQMVCLKTGAKHKDVGYHKALEIWSQLDEPLKCQRKRQKHRVYRP